MKKIDHYAQLVIHDIASFDKKTTRSLIKWLRRWADEIESEDPKIFAKRFRAKLMK